MYAKVRFVPSGITVFIPVRWIKGFTDYHYVNQEKEYVCFYSNNPTADPDFNTELSYKYNPHENRVYKGHVLNVYGNKRHDQCKDLYDANICESLQSEQELIHAIEYAITDQSSETRINALQTIAQILIYYFLPHITENYKIQIINCIEKSLINGGASEQCLATQLVPLLMLRMGGANDVSAAIGSLLLKTAQNQTKPAIVRSKCCSALGLMNFLSKINTKELILAMKQQEAIFNEGYQNGDQLSGRWVGATANEVHCAALSAWGLLLTLLPGSKFCSLYNNVDFIPSITIIIGMLESSDIDIRMTSAEVLALVLECGRSHEANFLEEYLPEIIDCIKRLAHDITTSNDIDRYIRQNNHHNQYHYHEHRTTFAAILRFIERNISPNIKIQFGENDVKLNTWASYHQYSTLYSVVGPTMTSHLIENQFLRDILLLGTKNVNVVKHRNSSPKERDDKTRPPPPPPPMPPSSAPMTPATPPNSMSNLPQHRSNLARCQRKILYAE